MSDRRKLRKTMHSDPKNLCEYVVKSVIEYKEELVALEDDIRSLKNKIAYLERINEGLIEQNSLLIEENDQKQEKIDKLILRFGNKTICYNCSHFMECGQNALCIHCQQKICYCCFEYCQVQECTYTVCKSCFSYFPNCPAHSENYPRERREYLIQYFHENKN